MDELNPLIWGDLILNIGNQRSNDKPSDAVILTISYSNIEDLSIRTNTLKVRTLSGKSKTGKVIKKILSDIFAIFTQSRREPIKELDGTFAEK
ncbi:MAG TPA: hypothetical protein VK612_03500 [Pyrinomonadaceae bacterium]|nr:hypothetical protein [Pyrinomonadaceae bacterium]